MRIAFVGLFPLAVIALIVAGIFRMRSPRARKSIDGHAVRRFFQYFLLYSLMVLSAVGLSGLLGRVLEGSALVLADKSDLARNLAFVVVALPLYLFLAFWTRRQIIQDPSESESFGWGSYLALTSITSLAVGMFALHDMVLWAFRINDFRGFAFARLLVWGSVWGVHWLVSLRFARLAGARFHLIIGSFIALVTVVFGVSQLISAAIHRVWNFGGETLFTAHGDSVTRASVTLIVGAPIWYLYWVRNFSRSKRDPLWYGYVLLVGVGGGLALAIVSASSVLYSGLVWLLGDPVISNAANHFHNLPTAIGGLCAGSITWWYHHVLLEDREVARTEVQRVYEYLMSGMGLLAAAGGLSMILVALVESLTTSHVLTGSGVTNALLAAATLLVIGSPVWWIYWHRIQVAILANPDEERSSLSRRFYLFILFGVGGIVAVVTLLVAVFVMFDDIFKGNFGTETIRRMRFALSILFTTGAISGYHWWIYRNEREAVSLGRVGPRLVILVGASDAHLVRSVSKLTGGRVQLWSKKDAQVENWNHESVIEALKESENEAVILLEDPTGFSVIPIELE